MLTPRRLMLLEVAREVAEKDAYAANAIGFMPRIFAKANLPYTNPDKNPNTKSKWERSNGKYNLEICSGTVLSRNGEMKRLGIPYGVIPRLIISWLATEVVRNKSPKIRFRKKLVDFMTELEMGSTGGNNGSITRFKEQLVRLFSSTITVKIDNDNIWNNYTFKIADELFANHFKKSNVNEKCNINIDCTLSLDDWLFTELKDHSFPVDMRVVHALRKSTLSLDIYTWLTSRVYKMSGMSNIPWKYLKKQFGSQHGRTSDFVSNFKKCLEEVQLFYPDIKVEATRKELKLRPSPSHVSAKKAVNKQSSQKCPAHDAQITH